MAEESILSDIRERLHTKGIHELRQIARAVGVAHPADGRRDRLIEEITLIATAELQPSPRSARGAPPKSMEYDKKLVADIEACAELYAVSGDGRGEDNLAARDGSLEERDCRGVLQSDKRRCFLRTAGPFACNGDIFVGETFIKRFCLKDGDFIEGGCRRDDAREISGLTSVKKVNGISPDRLKRFDFEGADAVYPDKRLVFTDGASGALERMCDLFAPVGMGQRAIISGAPNSGKTTLLKAIGAGICRDNGNFRAVILLVGRRPEEITEIKREFKNADIYFTTFDSTGEEHKGAAKFVADIVRSRAECDIPALLLVDGLEKLWAEDRDAAKKILAAAKNTESGQSVTVIAALSDSAAECQSELSESANCLIRLSADGHLLDIASTYTRKNNLLQGKEEALAADNLRRMAARGEDIAAEFSNTASNAQLIEKYGR